MRGVDLSARDQRAMMSQRLITATGAPDERLLPLTPCPLPWGEGDLGVVSAGSRLSFQSAGMTGGRERACLVVGDQIGARRIFLVVRR
jgi:hypothetical protein